MADDRNANVAAALRAYGSAIRGYWGDLDGRSVKAQLNGLADALTDPTKRCDLPWLIVDLGVCIKGVGDGHWPGSWGYCSDIHPDDPTSTEDDYYASLKEA